MEQFLLGHKVTALLLKGTVLAILFGLCLYYSYTTNVATAVKNISFITAAFCLLFALCDITLKLSNLLIQVTYFDITVDAVTIVSNTFVLHWEYVSLIVLSVLILLVVFVKEGSVLEFMWKFHPLLTVLCSILSWMLLKMITEPSMSSPISAMKGLDYGSAMAYNYYYGYLKIVLPSTGTKVKGLIEKMQNIEDAHNITFAMQKLIILIPASSYIPPDLREVSDNWMESGVNLEEEERDRAGVKRRVYRNNVYKIYPNGRKYNTTPVFVVAEGATPLLTFYEVQKHSHPETELYKRYHVDIVRSFYTKLKELLDNDPECRDNCELIYYNDYYNNKAKVNVAKIILDRLSMQQNATY